MKSKWMAVLLGLLMAVGLATAKPALAAYPDRPITIIVPLPPGGPADMVARIVGQKLQQRLGQPVTIDNRPGALGLIAAEIGAHAKPDGYTILMVASSLPVLVATQPKNIHFDIHKDLMPLTYAVKVPMMFAANISAPFKTMREFVDYAKAHPGALSVGVSPGSGGISHLTLERMKLGVGMDVVAVPYKGSAPALQALLSNEVPVIIDTVAGASSLIDDGKVRALATLTDAPAVGHTQIPTIAAAGFPGYDSDTWNGFMMPGGTPHEIIDLLHKEITDILHLPDVTEKILAVGLEPATNTPGQFSESFDRSVALWAQVAKDAKLKFD